MYVTLMYRRKTMEKMGAPPPIYCSLIDGTKNTLSKYAFVIIQVIMRRNYIYRSALDGSRNSGVWGGVKAWIFFLSEAWGLGADLRV